MSARAFHSKVAGIAANNEDGSSRQKIAKKCKTGERLSLVRDPKNRYDRNAIKVLRLTGEQLGWISRDLAADLAGELDKNPEAFDVEVANVTGGGWFSKRTRGINILVRRR